MSYRLINAAAGGAFRAGLLVDETVYDLLDALGPDVGFDAGSTLGVLLAWDSAEPLLRALAEAPRGRSQSLAAVTLGPPVLPGNIYCAAANYFDHYREMHDGKERVKDAVAPYFFQKTTRSVTGPHSKVSCVDYAKNLDWEAEIVAVIGRRARNAPAASALDYVAGYCVGNDLSLRDVMIREDWPAVRTDWLAAKSFEGSGPMGPWLTPAAEVQDPQALHIQTWVNDAVEQDTNSRDMIYTIAEQIAFLSARFPLEPGDVIFTGTGGGVGEAKNRFMKRGDICRVRIEKLGEIRTEVI